MATELCEFQAMGSPFRIQIDYNDKNTRKVQQQIHALFHDLRMEVEQLEARFSRFRPASELTRFNQRIGEFVPITPQFKQLLEIAEDMHRLTDGVFDPRILQNLEDIGYTGAQLYVSDKLDPAPQAAERHPKSAHLFEWNGTSSVCIDQPIDLGGIGKGFAADLLADRIDMYVSRDKWDGYIVDAGGDLVIGGCQSNGEPWSIGLENPFAPQELAAAISLPCNQRTAVCTSSLWKRAWRFGSADVHHLIDPATGKPMETQLMSVTVISPKATISEAMTKYVFMRGTAKQLEMNEFPGSVISIGKNKCIYSTGDVLPLLTWTSPELEFVSPSDSRSSGYFT